MNPPPTLLDTCARIEDAATDILTLVEGLDFAEYGRSRLTRGATTARLHHIAGLAALLAPAERQAMPEVDWEAWTALNATFAGGGDVEREWAAASGLAELTLQWMRVYRQAAK